MGENLNKTFDFSIEYTKSPDQIVEEICKELSDATNGYVQVNILKYDGAVVSYNRMGIAKAIANMTTLRVDIQTELGALNEGDLRFEVIITAPYIESFKYRPFFLNYGIGGYPARVIVEQEIVDEIFGEDENYIVKCDTEEEFKNLIINIFNCSKMHDLMQGIINETRRQLNVVSEQ